jgi:leucyl-tRNA synthetase
MATASSTPLAAQAGNTTKRDFLIQLEKDAQKRWKAEKAFEADSPYLDGSQKVPDADFAKDAAKLREHVPKWFGTFPYPVRPCFVLRD